MQAFTHMTWLNEPDALDHQKDGNQHARHWGRALAGVFALVLAVIFSATLLSN
jgi:hypothetical protein